MMTVQMIFSLEVINGHKKEKKSINQRMVSNQYTLKQGLSISFS